MATEMGQGKVKFKREDQMQQGKDKVRKLVAIMERLSGKVRCGNGNGAMKSKV